MMTLFLLNCLVGFAGYEGLFLAGSWACGERTLAAPFFVFPMAIICGVQSIWWGWIGTCVLVGLQAILVVGETWRVRRSWQQSR